LATNLEQQEQLLSKFKAELANLKQDQGRAKQAASGGLFPPDLKSAEGKKLLAKYTESTKLVNAKQKEYDTLKKKIDDTKAKAKVVGYAGSDEEALRAAAEGLTVQELRAKLAKDLQKKNRQEANVATGEVAADLNKEYQQDVLESGRYIAGLDDAGRTQLAISLNDVYGSKLPTNGKYSKELKDTYVKALTDNYTRSLDFNQKTSLPEFLVIAKNEGTYKGTGTGGPEIDDYVTISSPSIAKNAINQVFQAELQRDATKEELDKLIPGLISAQKKNPNRVKVVKGVRQTTQGLDAIQWITDKLQKLPEYAQRKEDKTIPDLEKLQTTARNNGLTLLPNQLESYKLRLQNGEKLETIQSNIRANIANTMPDSVKKLMDAGNDLSDVYQPYRQSMAAILEIPFDKIDLSDPTLTNAITDKGNMTIFDFKKSLRKDPRWQYTDNAREVVSSGLTQVLKDFGFMG
jgi:hypothetical protein